MSQAILQRKKKEGEDVMKKNSSNKNTILNDVNLYSHNILSENLTYPRETYNYQKRAHDTFYENKLQLK